MSQQTFTNIVAVACGDERIQQVLLSETDQGLVYRQQNKMTNPRRTEGCERHDNEGEIVYSDCWTCCVWRNGNVWTSVWNCWYITWVHLAQMKNIDTMHDCCLLRAFVITLTENFSFLSSKETVCPCQLFFSLLFFDVSNAEMKSSPRVVPIAISSLSLTPLYNSDYIKELYKKKKK